MHTVEIPEAKKRFYIPNDLSECTAQQYIDMCELIFRFQNEEITFEELKTFAVYKLANLKAVKSPFGIDNDDKYSNIYLISGLIDNFFEENESDQKVIVQNYVHNPVPKFRPLWKNYYGPSSGFMNLTFGEYTDALRMFHDFHATGESKLLLLLCALFYRRKKSFHFIKKHKSNYDGDIREPYNANTLEKRAKVFEFAPLGFVYGTYLLFASFQKYLVEAKIMWGGQELDLSILFESDGASENSSVSVPGIGMDSIAFTMAESGAFGNLEKVRSTNFWQVIIRMYELRRNDIERKKTENAGNK